MRVQARSSGLFRCQKRECRAAGWKELKASLTCSQLENIFTSAEECERKRARFFQNRLLKRTRMIFS